MKALVIDSSRLMRTLLHGLLEQRGFEVVEAADCRQALGWAPAQDADVVFVEWDLSNSEVFASIPRARRRWARAATFILMADVEPEPRAVFGAKTIGVDRILVKPFTAAQLDAELMGCWFGGQLEPSGLSGPSRV